MGVVWASPEQDEVWVRRCVAGHGPLARGGRRRCGRVRSRTKCGLRPAVGGKRPSPRKSANREMICMAVGPFFENTIQNVFSENQNGPTNPNPHTGACQGCGRYMRGKEKKKKKENPTSRSRLLATSPQHLLNGWPPALQPLYHSGPQAPVHRNHSAQPRCRLRHTPSWGDRPACPGALPGGDLTVASAPNRT